MRILLTFFVLLIFPTHLYAEMLKCKTEVHGKFFDKSSWEDFSEKEYIINVNNESIDLYDIKMEWNQEFDLVLNNSFFLNGFFTQTSEDEGDWIGMVKYNKLTNGITMMYSNPFGETIEMGFCK